MQPTRRSVVDIGTNSVKLLVADVDGNSVIPVIECSEQTRLGRGFYVNHTLQPAAIEQTAKVVGDFVGRASKLASETPRLIATSAARDARNAGDLIRAIQAATGLDLEIIDGDTEARWSFEGVTSSVDHADDLLLITDVGGGSSELILGRGREAHSHHSFALGTVRLLEKFSPADPPSRTDWDRCHDWLTQFMATTILNAVNPVWQLLMPGRPTLVATGGTAVILARTFLESDTTVASEIERARLNRKDLRALRRKLWSLPIQERRELPGLPASRADVILFGAAILEAMMDAFDLDQMRASTRGLRHAALRQNL